MLKIILLLFTLFEAVISQCKTDSTYDPLFSSCKSKYLLTIR